jgi:hypothetical protein
VTTSGTYTFAPQVDELLLEAWERIGLSGSVMTGDIARSARRSLQYLLGDWTNRDLRLWQVERWNTTVLPGVQLIQAPPATVDILELVLTVSNGIEILLGRMSRDEWIGIPNKAQQARPNSFWIERRTDNPVIHLWPVPDKAYPLGVNRLRVPQDVSALSQTVDAPVLWAEAIASGLAAALALKFAPARYPLLKQLADAAYENAATETRERRPLTILPRSRL